VSSRSIASRAARRQAAADERRARTRRLVRWALLFVSAVIVVNALIGDRGLVAMIEARRDYDRLAADVARTRAENARLREEARRLREDPAAIEDLARQELGLIRPGEKVFIVKDLPAIHSDR
jgi:cell division protein FtsB